MAQLIFADGFENLAMAIAKNVAFTSGVQQNGPNMRGNSVSVPADTVLFSTDKYRLYAFRFKPLNTGTGLIIDNRGDGNSSNWRLDYDQSNYYVRRVDNSIIATHPRVGNNWIYVEYQTVRSNSAAVRCRIDGIDLVNSGTYDCSDNNAHVVDLHDDGWYDDFIVVDDPATDMSDMIGSVAIQRLSPTGNGFHTDWTGDYTDVDEIPHSTADDINSTGPGDRESYTFPAPGTALTSLEAVVWEVTGRGAPANPLFRSSGGTTAVNTAEQLPFPEEYGDAVTRWLTQNPVTAAAWATGDLTSGEFGLEQVS